MKTQILVVESFDIIPSLMDKIANSDAPRLILTAEPLPDWMRDSISIRLIARKAIEEGKQVGIVSPDLGTRKAFEEAGIQVFDDLTSAQHDRWRDISTGRFTPNPTGNLTKPQELVSKGEAVTKSLEAKIGISILAFLTILALLAAFVPKAMVTISLKKNSDRIVVPVEVGSQFTGISLTGSIPAEIRTFNISNISTSPVSNQGLVPKSFATGVVVFSNLTNLEQAMPAGISLSTSSEPPVLFVTKENARLEGKTGSEVEVAVVARDAGENSNVGAGEVTRINSILGTQMTVRNDLPISGGTSELVSLPGPIDRNAVRAKALDEIKSKALKEAHTSLTKNEILVEPSYRVSRTVSENYYPEVGQPGDHISLELELEAQVLVIKSEDLAQYYNEVTGLGVVKEEQYLPVDASDLQLTCKSKGVTDQFSCTVSGMKQTITPLSQEEVRSMIWGRNKKEIEKDLRSAFPQITDVRIDQYPSGWPWLPLIPNLLTVEIQ